MSPRGYVDGAGREHDVRDRIFASALRHFSWKGYTATSLRDICADAETTKPMVYYYFGSKEQLYSVIVREILEDMAVAIRRDLREASAAAEAIAYCERYMDHFLANEESIALVMREVFGLGGVPLAAFAEAFATRIRQPLDDILCRGMESGELRRDDVGACAMAITGIMNMFILAHVFGRAAIDRQIPIRQVHHHLRGLGAQ